MDLKKTHRVPLFSLRRLESNTRHGCCFFAASICNAPCAGRQCEFVPDFSVLHISFCAFSYFALCFSLFVLLFSLCWSSMWVFISEFLHLVFEDILKHLIFNHNFLVYNNQPDRPSYDDHHLLYIIGCAQVLHNARSSVESSEVLVLQSPARQPPPPPAWPRQRPRRPPQWRPPLPPRPSAQQ